MNEMIEQAVAALNEKLDASGFDGTDKFVIEDEGAIMLDANGARAEDGEADVTMTSDVETFTSILAGELNPTAAFMSQRLKVDGDMGAALRLGAVLS